MVFDTDIHDTLFNQVVIEIHLVTEKTIQNLELIKPKMPIIFKIYNYIIIEDNIRNIHNKNS